ncbi:MAG: 6-bladed beta-propeller [Tannerella sp.]|nr:6-bladed beta-propeller [Tannerella sp.]
MKNLLLFLTAYLILLSSCSPKAEVAGELSLIRVDPSDVTEYYDLANDVEEEYDFVELETLDTCLIDNIDIVVFQNDHYYVYDGNGSTVFLFDTAGRFVSKLFKQGQGPDEYIRLDGFALKDSTIWVVDPMTGYMIAYDSRFKMIDRIDMKETILPDHLDFIGDTMLVATNWWGSKKSNIQFGMYHVKSKRMEGLLSVGERPANAILYSKASQMAISGNSCLFDLSHCDTIFELKDGVFAPRYKMAFTERYEDIHLTEEEYFDISKKYLIRGIEDIKQTKNAVWLGFYNNRIFNSAVYNKESKTTQVYSAFINSNISSKLEILQHRTYMDRNNEILVSIHNVEDVLAAFKTDESISKIKNEVMRKKIKAIVSGLAEDANPLLLKQKIRKDAKL